MNRIPFVTEGVLDIASDINSSLAAADGLITSRISGFLTEPPANALDDSRYGVSAGASGKWFGKDGQLALYVAEGDFWKFYSPLHVFYRDTLYVSNGFSWTPVEGRLENKGKVVQTKGQSIYDVMSQKSVTDELNTKADTSYTNTELFKKVDKVEGQSLFKDTERTKLSGIATEATKNRSDAEMDAIWNTKVDKVVGKELSDTNFTQVEKTKLSGVAVGATKNATDAQLRDRTTHTGEQPISTVTSLQSTLDSKVDKIAGKGLSTSDFTPAEKAKLASLESSKYRGSYPSLAALQAANPNPSAGEYADVDSGVGKDTTRWIWDNTDSAWIDLGAAPALTPAQVKALYEENGDTNAYTDEEKTKLSGIAAESTKNATDAQLRARASHTGVQAISTVTGLQAGLDSKVDKVDGKELSANDFTSVLKTKLDSLPSGVGGLIPLSAGGTGATSAATARTALQLGNAVTHNYGTGASTVMMGNDSRANNGQTAFSWGNHASVGYALEGTLNYAVGTGLILADKKLDINFGTVAGTVVQGNDSRVNNGQAAFNRLNIGATAATARTAIGLGNVENTRDVDKTVGSFTVHDTRDVISVPNNVPARTGLFEFKLLSSVGTPPKPSSPTYAHVLTTNGWTADGTGGWPTQVSLGDALSFRKGTGVTTWGQWYELISTNTTLGATGQSPLYPMTQKATTDALNTKAATSHTHTWAQVTGQPATATRWPTFDEVTGKPATYAPSGHTHPTSQVTGLDTALAGKADKTTQVIAGTGLTGGGTLAANRTLAVTYGTAAGTAAQGNDSRITGALQKSQVVQVTGTSTINVMSQKAVTDAINTRTASLLENIKVTVGAGGDFPTINAAVLHLSRFTPELGVTAEVELRSGFVMSEQLLVDGLNLGWITITGVDAETVINEPSLTRSFSTDDDVPAFGVASGTLPTIGQLFRFSSKGNATVRTIGVMAYRTGRATILEGCGVKDCGYYGIYVNKSSTINAEGAVVSGAGQDGIHVTRGSTINAGGVDASGAGVNGIVGARGATINVEFANVSGANLYGISLNNNSTASARGVDASGAGSGGFDINTGSIINAHNATGTLTQAKNTVTARGIIFQP